MFYRLTVKRKDFHFEEFFAAKRHPTKEQFINYYSNPDRTFGEMCDMIQVVLYLLKSKKCTLPELRKVTATGESTDAKGQVYLVVLQRIDMTPLAESDNDVKNQV